MVLVLARERDDLLSLATLKTLCQGLRGCLNLEVLWLLVLLLLLLLLVLCLLLLCLLLLYLLVCADLILRECDEAVL